MQNNASKLLDTLWQLQRDPDFKAGDILLNSELSADEGQVLQLQLLDMPRRLRLSLKSRLRSRLRLSLSQTQATAARAFHT